MKYGKKIFISIFWVILGVVFWFLNLNNKLDSYWSGLGTAFIVIGILQIVRQLKYRTNAKYREEIDTRNNDERNKYIGTKAWAWAGYLYILLSAVAIIVLQIMGLKDISHIISMTVCAIIVLYWVCWMILSKKY